MINWLGSMGKLGVVGAGLNAITFGRGRQLAGITVAAFAAASRAQKAPMSTTSQSRFGRFYLNTAPQTRRWHIERLFCMFKAMRAS